MKPKGVVAASMPQWISVKDRLPEDYVDVLAYSEHEGIVIGLWGLSDITHWMPLPEPPREAANA